ncbi:LuxR C-terminal-related transcriptional regulator [Dyadobacter sp. LHD-138]|uniref:helix-turn-helix transcriptional regulator n=1 Tax=Dyadobacter sp. LHD-138 TaxID=3071413 RepID=UPI0027E176CA|nr:LuxR C-terminal-related transcriptional regulator [Dyadobacter sp. LHD-138]MDQ6477271.1 LuxR C-terminal-related transcriptional regulator [Dyadobacter sp. LHD-138]
MATTISLNVCSFAGEKSEDIVFFSSEGLHVDSEEKLVAKVRQILSLSRNFAASCKLIIRVQTRDPEFFIHAIKKLTVTKSDVRPANLSIREIEVLGLIMQGLTNNQIAEKLFISFETVKSHRKNILEKTGAKNTAALIHHYHQTFFDKE